MTRQCTAALFEGPGHGFSLNTMDLSPLDAGEVLVEVTACAVCGSDLHTIAGRRPCPQHTILGHEIVGKVVDTQGTVADWSGTPLVPGDRITWSIAASCGSCFYCTRDLPQKCEHLTKYGHADPTQNGPLGGFASHCRLLAGTAIFRLPDELSDLEAVPANCCTATSVAAVRMAEPIGGNVVLVLGAGSLGLTIAEFALHNSASSVILADINSHRLEQASKIAGCIPLLLDASTGETATQRPEVIDDVTKGHGVDVAIDVSGASSAIEAALGWLRIGGQAILVGSVFESPSIPLDPQVIVRRMLRISGLHNYRPDDLQTALAFLGDISGSATSRSLVGASFPLSDIDDAIEAAHSQTHLRVAVIPTA